MGTDVLGAKHGVRHRSRWKLDLATQALDEAVTPAVRFFEKRKFRQREDNSVGPPGGGY
jgi:hypothetical protein